MYIISIHASAKEATQFAVIGSYVIKDFNPRLREGGDVVRYSLPESSFVFQSTPPRRRRQHNPAPLKNNHHFNPRLREGGDAAQLAASQASQNISIHASAKEATTK